MRRQTDDTPTLESVFRENLPALYRLAYTLLRQREEAEDAVQDAWLRMAGASGAQAELRHPRGWMFRILRNLCIDRLRPATEPVTDTGHEVAEALARTMAAIERMPGELAEILTLVVVEQMSYREAALVLEIPVGTVRSRLNRARRTLRAMLDEENRTPRALPLEEPS